MITIPVPGFLLSPQSWATGAGAECKENKCFALIVLIIFLKLKISYTFGFREKKAAIHINTRTSLLANMMSIFLKLHFLCKVYGGPFVVVN